MHPYGESHRLLSTFYSTKFERIANAIVSSLAAGRPINAWLDIFLQVTSPSLPGRAEVPYDKYIYIYVIYCLFWTFILCAELRRYAIWTFKKSWWYHCSRHHICIYGFIFSISLWLYLYRTKIAFRNDQSFLWHQVLGLNISSNN